MRELDLEIYGRSNTIYDFWLKAHNHLESFWTSGTSWEYIKDVFNLDPKFINGSNVLVNGVGQGNELFGAQSEGANVQGYDLVVPPAEALKVFEIFDPSNRPPSSSFDLILCHLVFQHCDDLTSIEILKIIELSLKDAGTAKIQFSIPMYDFVEKKDLNLDVLKSGSNHRDITAIYKLFENTNLKILKFQPTKYFAEFKIVHATLEAKRMSI
jgi:hypothetical protein